MIAKAIFKKVPGSENTPHLDEKDEGKDDAEASIRRCAMGAVKIIRRAIEKSESLGQNHTPTDDEATQYADDLHKELKAAGLDNGEQGIAAIIAGGISDGFGHQELIALHRLRKARIKFQNEEGA